MAPTLHFLKAFFTTYVRHRWLYVAI